MYHAINNTIYINYYRHFHYVDINDVIDIVLYMIIYMFVVVNFDALA